MDSQVAAGGSLARPRLMMGLFSLTVFFNAALLFSVEPMFAKIVLPYLGGTPSVWNTCLVFFQFALLVGYLYAHFSTQILSLRNHVIAHGCLLVTSCALLPLQLRIQADPPDGSSGILWLLALLATSLGIPFVMLGSGALIVQRWFSQSSHARAANPYFLYGASNLGSLIALMGYPFVIEPLLSLRDQRILWSWGYVLLVGLVILCARLAITNAHRRDIASPVPVETVPQLTWRERGRLVLFSAVPASLLLSVTTYLSTDVAAAPLLWILPLAVYLLTFVLVFDVRDRLPHSWMMVVQGYLLVLICIPIFLNTRIPGLSGIVLHLLILFVIAMVCHGDLARWKPPAARLTEFFVWISVGGLVGGIFGALIAPVAFDSIAEYPLLLALAAMLRPTDPAKRWATTMDLLLVSLLFLGLLILRPQLVSSDLRIVIPISILLGGVLFSFRHRPARFGLAIGAVFLAANAAAISDGATSILSERSYFGVYRVEEQGGGRLRILQHGTTLHGAQSLVRGQELEPRTYYHRLGPAGEIFSRTPAALKATRNIAVVGL